MTKSFYHYKNFLITKIFCGFINSQIIFAYDAYIIWSKTVLVVNCKTDLLIFGIDLRIYLNFTFNNLAPKLKNHR